MESGARVGPYEILSRLGAGGMGEVWKARDTRLDRSVAIKILPPEFAQNAQLKMRLEREAKTISQLTHPHICTLYDVGSTENGQEYLVMELLEGETLADRLMRGQLPLDQLLRYGIQIAEALEKAHRAGVVHRDLKPGNIMLTKGGAKLLDFGLAKPASSPLTQLSSATVMPTEHKPLTEEGSIVGTFQYMAPEQIEGREADARTDIFAFGAVLYEMATGQRAFEAKSKASLIASILDREPPPISNVQPVAPAAFERVMRRCLKKEPDERWQSAHDVAIELQWIAEGVTGATATAQPRRFGYAAWALAGLLAVSLAVVTALYMKGLSAPRAQVRFSISPPPETTWNEFNSFSISPDGRNLVFFAATAKNPNGMLYIRPVDSLLMQPLPDTEDASFPFWSPDSKSVGFFVPGKLKKINVSGGPPETLCDARDGRGGSWSRDDVIVFAPAPRSVIHRVAAAGGIPVPVLKMDSGGKEESQEWPAFLPDGKHFIYRSTGWRGQVIVAAPLATGEQTRVLVAADAAVLAPPNGLLYLRQRTALVQQLDAKKLMLVGDAVPVAEDLGYNVATGYAAFACSNEGSLLFRAAGVAPLGQFLWLDRTGKEVGRLAPQGSVGDPSISPDGKRVAYSVMDPLTRHVDIWVADAARGTTTRLTFDAGDEFTPAWSPDGSRIAYARTSDKESSDIVQKLSSGAGDAESIVSGRDIAVNGWSRDGRTLLYEVHTDRKAKDVMALDLATKKSIVVAGSQFREWEGRFSPDGRFVAYVSGESGHPEVFVQTFPPTGGRWQISNLGGVQPVWSRDGKELAYLDLASRICVVPIATDARGAFDAGVPQPLFTPNLTGGTDSFGHFDIAADGRFIVDTQAGQRVSPPITVVLNWTPKLGR